MEAPKSPWRYPHLMFRDSRKSNKNVSFKRERGNLNLPDGASGFGTLGMMRRADSKDSDCSSMSSAPQHGHPGLQGHHAHHHLQGGQQGRDDLRHTFSVPPFQKFRRTDSSESSNSSLASFGLGNLMRGVSKNKKRATPLAAAEKGNVSLVGGVIAHNPIERADSGQSVISRGFTVMPGENGTITVVSTGEDAPPQQIEIAGDGAATVPTTERENNDEVAIIVSGRKDSTTKAVR